MSASASAAACPATSAAVTAARNVTASDKRAGGRPLALYSSEFVEEEFSEVRGSKVRRDDPHLRASG